MPLTDDQLRNLLDAGETDGIERKRNADTLDRICEAVCGFANDLPNRQGPGVVFVGLNDDGTCANLTVDDRLLLRLGQVRERLSPFPTMAIRHLKVGACDVVAVIVEPSGDLPVRFDGRAWVRVGPSRRIASPADERSLLEKRVWANLPFDGRPVSGSTLNDLDLVRFRLEYLPAAVSPDVIAQNGRTVEQQLMALGLINASAVPTGVGILMLGKTPQQYFPSASVEWRKIDGLSLADDTLDQRSILGSVPDQLRAVDELLRSTLTSSVLMTADKHIRMSAYPLAALQQLIRNAVMHRTYEGTNAPVRVTWYSDRIEIQSPGGPYGSVTPGVFGKPGYTDYRNPNLAHALKAYGYVERFGQGFEIARVTLEANGNPPVDIKLEPPEAPMWVHLTVRAHS